MLRGFHNVILIACGLLPLVSSTPVPAHEDKPPVRTQAERMQQMEEEIRHLRDSLQEKDRQIDLLFEQVRKLTAAQLARAQAATQPATRPDETPEQTLRRVEREVLREMLQEQQAGRRGTTRPAGGKPGLLPYDADGVEFRLVDVSAMLNVAAGGSTARDPALRTLQGGAHDPQRRGFTLQQFELAALGSVDPYFDLRGHIVFHEDEVELEEAFATTKRWETGTQVEAGYFYTEFGIINHQHPHDWDFLDQPVIIGRMFGSHNQRGVGFRVGQLLPLPWTSELHVGMQDARNESMASFLGEPPGHDDEGDHAHLFEETIGGRPAVERRTRSLEDFVYLVRWANRFDIRDDLAAQAGLSALHGPNRTGGNTWVYGGDWVLRWKAKEPRALWRHLTWQSEVLGRDFRADRFTDEAEGMALPGQTLHDWGLYTQIMYGLLEKWDAGARFGFATGHGTSFHDGLPERRDEDPFRNDRQRYSFLVAHRPTKWSCLRLQYNYDRADHLTGGHDHSLWLGLEVVIGNYPSTKD